MSQTEVQLIKDAVIVNADISNSAAIDVSKISGAMPLAGGTFTGVTEFTANAKFDGATAGRDITFLRSTNTLRFQDNTIVGLGDSDDFKMFHNGTITRFVHDLAGANLEFQSDNYVFKDKDNGDVMMKLLHDGAVELYHDNSKKFETTSGGIELAGNIIPDANNTRNIGNGTNNFNAIWASTRFRGNDNVSLQLGNSVDFKILHDGTTNLIESPTGSDLHIKMMGNTNDVADQVSAKFIEDGAVELYHNGNKKIETTSSGVSVTGALTSTGLTVNGGTSPATIDHTGGNALELTRSSKTLAFNANFGAANTHAAVNISSGMELRFQINAADKIKMTTAGDWVPTSDNARNLGATSLRWANIYTNDLQLSNEGSQNDVDSTWGNYTIQEGHEDLFLINNRTGKKFKFNLTEVA